MKYLSLFMPYVLFSLFMSYSDVSAQKQDSIDVQVQNKITLETQPQPNLKNSAFVDSLLRKALADAPIIREYLEVIDPDNQLQDPYNIAPLDTIIARAIKVDPKLKSKQEIVKGGTYKLHAERKRWLDMFSVQASGSYGTGSALSSTDNGLVVASNVINQTSLLYNAGLVFKFNPFFWLSRKDNLAFIETEIAKSRFETDITVQELRAEVIRRYQEYLLKLELLSLFAQAMETGLLYFHDTEHFFQTGSATMAEYNEALQRRIKAQTEFEKARSEFQTAFLMLKEIAGGNIF